jgi:hypothetical protein
VVPLLGCAATQGPLAVDVASASYTEPLGIVTASAAGVPCFTGAQLEAGVEVLVFEEGVVPVARLVSTGETCADEPAGRRIDVTPRHRTRLAGEGSEVATLAVGVALDGRIVAGADGSVDLDRDGKMEAFFACTSSEGVHLTVWSESMETARRLWHSYVYLGYDTEPTCTDAQVAQ